MPDVAPARAEDRQAAAVVRASDLFAADFYLATAGDAALQDPALHYVVVGEPQGLAASPRFSAATYAALNTDLVGAPMNLLVHYEAHGRAEGRAIAFESEDVGLDFLRLDRGKPVVLLLIHEASYSGAPLLGWNLTRELKLTRNVVVVLIRGGALQPALSDMATAVVGPLSSRVATHPGELKRLAQRLAAFYRPTYAIADSVETRLVATALREEGVPYVALVHEFATHAPPHALKRFYERGSALVFPSELVRRSSLERYGLIAQRATYILPQGPSDIPPLPSSPPPAAAAGGRRRRARSRPCDALGRARAAVHCRGARRRRPAQGGGPLHRGGDGAAGTPPRRGDALHLGRRARASPAAPVLHLPGRADRAQRPGGAAVPLPAHGRFGAPVRRGQRAGHQFPARPPAERGDRRGGAGHPAPVLRGSDRLRRTPGARSRHRPPRRSPPGHRRDRAGARRLGARSGAAGGDAGGHAAAGALHLQHDALRRPHRRAGPGGRGAARADRLGGGRPHV